MEYIITQKKIASELGIPAVDIIISPRKQKKYRIIFQDGSYVDYGAKDMEDFLIHKDEARRRRFHQRFKNNKGYNNPESGLFYSARLLW